MGALANLGYVISDQTVGNILHRHALPPAPERKRTTTWPAFIRTHLALLAGTDFFTAEVLTLRGFGRAVTVVAFSGDGRRLVAGTGLNFTDLFGGDTRPRARVPWEVRVWDAGK